ncbi:hypothetical protein FIBSPDRAFT_892995, partial [Athelia psychrophila]
PSIRLASSATATTFKEIVALVPVSYREIMRKHLSLLSAMSNKCANAWASLKTLESHKACKTLPPQIAAMKCPSVSITKAFEAVSATSSPLVDATKATFDAARAKFLEQFITLKDNEHQWYQKQCKADVYLPPIYDELEAEFLTVVEATKIPKYGPATADSNNKRVFIGWEEDSIYRSEWNRFLADVPVLCNRARQLDVVQLSVKANNLKDKLALKSAVDVEMGDGTTEKVEQDRINKAVAAALKEHGVSPKRKEPPKKFNKNSKKDTRKDKSKQGDKKKTSPPAKKGGPSKPNKGKPVKKGGASSSNKGKQRA